MSTFLGRTWRARVARRLEVIVDPPFWNLHPIQQQQQPRVDRQSSCGAAHRRDAQLISWQVRVGTKEQLSGCWASTSSRSDFSCKTKGGEHRSREEKTDPGRSVGGGKHKCVVGSVAEAPRGGPSSFLRTFSHGAAQPKLSAPDTAQHSALPSLCTDRRHFFFSNHNSQLCGELKDVPVQRFPNPKPRTPLSCRLQVWCERRTAGSLRASGSERSVRCSYFIISLSLMT